MQKTLLFSRPFLPITGEIFRCFVKVRKQPLKTNTSNLRNNSYQFNSFETVSMFNDGYEIPKNFVESEYECVE